MYLYSRKCRHCMSPYIGKSHWLLLCCFLQAEAAADPNVLFGTSCCPGNVEGVVRVVRTIEEAKACRILLHFLHYNRFHFAIGSGWWDTSHRPNWPWMGTIVSNVFRTGDWEREVCYFLLPFALFCYDFQTTPPN